MEAAGRQCTVCLDEIKITEILALPCACLFHRDCVIDWLKRDFTCPNCRRPPHEFKGLIQPPPPPLPRIPNEVIAPAGPVHCQRDHVIRGARQCLNPVAANRLCAQHQPGRVLPPSHRNPDMPTCAHMDIHVSPNFYPSIVNGFSRCSPCQNQSVANGLCIDHHPDPERILAVPLVLPGAAGSVVRLDHPPPPPVIDMDALGPRVVRLENPGPPQAPPAPPAPPQVFRLENPELIPRIPVMPVSIPKVYRLDDSGSGGGGSGFDGDVMM